MRELKRAFSGFLNFKEYFAVKALPNPYIMKVLHREGLGADCSSLVELLLSEKAGILGEEIMFTSNATPQCEFAKALELGAIVNLDDISHISYLKQLGDLPRLVCLRYNPGPAREGNVIIGNPAEAKFGFTKEQLFLAYRELKNSGVERFGLHAMVASNELDSGYFVETVRMLLELVVEISKSEGIEFEFINMGGGIGIPYRPEEKGVDVFQVAKDAECVYEEVLSGSGFVGSSFVYGVWPVYHGAVRLLGVHCSPCKENV